MMGWTHKTHYEQANGEIRSGIETNNSTKNEGEVDCDRCKSYLPKGLEKRNRRPRR
jgi:hypothetical protein